MNTPYLPRLKIRELPTCVRCGAVMQGLVCDRCEAEPLPKYEKISERLPLDL